MTESLLDTPPVSTIVDPNKNYLEELVGDGKKFKSVEDLARGKYEADLHIALKNKEMDALTADYQRLRNEYNAGPKLQEVIDKLLAAKDTSSNEPPKVNEDTRNAFDPSQIDSLLEDKLQKMDAARKAQENWNQVKEKLTQTYGDKYSEVVKSQTQKLGLSAEKVDEFARTSPQVFFRLMGLEDQPQRESFQSPPRSSQQSSFAPSGAKTKKWSDYRAMLKTNPNLFSDPKAHNQMMEDIRTIGEAAFYDSP